MTMTLITLNATLGLAVVYGIVRLLVHGIGSEGAAGADVRALPQRDADRLAA